MFKRLAFLFLSLSLASSCQRFTPSVELLKPANVEAVRYTDFNQKYSLFEGEKVIEGQSFPDGRLWLINNSTGEQRLLTSESYFGEHFVALGGVLAPDAQTAYTLITKNNDAYNLYALSLEAKEPIFLSNARSLGLTEIIPESLSLSPDGKTLAFSAYEEVTLEPNEAEPFTWLLGVYTLDLRASSVKDSLKRVTQQAIDEAPAYFLPSFSPDGSLSIQNS